VAWRFSFRSEEEDILGLPEDALADLGNATVERAPNGLSLLREGALSAEWLRPKGVNRPGRGFLWEGHHHLPNEGTPSTTGIVRRVRLVACIYERTTGVASRPVRGEVRMRDVSRGPRRFAGPPQGDRRFAVNEVGVLVDLVVAR
jgi:hypothetical protein